MTERVYRLHRRWPPRPVRDIPGLPPLPATNDEFPDWKAKVDAIRVDRYARVSQPWHGQQDAIGVELRRIKADPRYLVNVYFGIYEARWDEYDDDDDIPWLKPFIMYPFQFYMWDWLDERMHTRGPQGDGIWIKARDMGATNLGCAYATTKFMLTKPFQGRLLSRKEDLVDDAYSSDSMFWKIEHFIKSVPHPLVRQLMPGFSWASHRLEGTLARPDNNNALTGESTNATAGRGSRCTLMILDELAFMRNPRGIWTATRPATRHRLGITSVSTEQGMFVHDLVNGSREFTEDRQPAILHVYNEVHPFHDAEWTEAERLRDTEAGFRQEVLMDWFADTSNFVYPQARTLKLGPYPYLPHQGPIYCSMDDGMDSHFAIVWLQYVTATGRHRVIQAYRNKGQITDFYGSLMAGVYDGQFVYGPDEDAIMEFVHTIPPPIYVGDSHGRNVEQTSGKSVHDVLAQNWGIIVNVDHERRSQVERINHLGAMIPYLDFHLTDGVADCLHSFQTYRWKRLRDGAEVVSEYKTPAHTEESHFATALEYYATNFQTFKSTFTGNAFVYYVDDDYDAVASGSPGAVVW